MDIVKQKYFDSFVCTAQKCAFTCCSGWEVAVDFKTSRLWQKTCPEYSKGIKKTAGGLFIKKRVYEDCKYLKNGLCTIISQKGEEYVPAGCRTFPRISKNAGGKTMLSLSCACIEAGKIIAGNPFEITGGEKERKMLEAIKELSSLESAGKLFGEEKTPDSQQKLNESYLLFRDITENYKKVPIFKAYFECFKNTKAPDEKLWKNYLSALAGFDETIKRLYMSKFFEYSLTQKNLEESLLIVLCEYVLMRLSVFWKGLSAENIIIYTAVFSRIIGSNETAVREYLGGFDKKYICSLL